MNDYFNFSYKDMTEFMGPCYYDCPIGILKSLSPTNDEYALSWREKCKEHYTHKKRLKQLTEGTRIRFKAQHDMSCGVKAGDEVELHKKYYLGRNLWFMNNSWTYWRENQIPQSFEVAS